MYMPAEPVYMNVSNVYCVIVIAVVRMFYIFFLQFCSI